MRKNAGLRKPLGGHIVASKLKSLQKPARSTVFDEESGGGLVVECITRL